MSTLGFWQTVQAIYHDDYAGSGTLASAIRLKGVAPAQLEAALTELFADLACLGAPVQEANARLNVGAPVKPPLTHFDGKVDAWLASELRPLTPEAPARLAWIPDGDGGWLGLTVLHAVADARTTATWLSAIGRRAKGHKVSLPPPLHDGLEAKALRPPKGGAPLPGPDREWAFEGSAPLTRRTAALSRVSLPIGPIKALAHQRGVTVGTLLASAALAAKGPTNGRRARLSLAVDLRPWAGARAVAGCQIIMLALAPRVSGDLFKDAAALRGELQQALEARLSRPLVPPRFSLGVVRSLIRETLTQGEATGTFPGGLCVSNLGALPPYPGQTDFVFSTAQPSGLYGAFLGAASLGGRLQLTASGAVPLVSQATLDGLTREIAARLKALPD